MNHPPQLQYLVNASEEVPQELLEESKYWSFPNSFVLSPGSADELIRSFMEHRQIPDVKDEKFGFSLRLRKAIKGHCVRVAALSLRTNDQLIKEGSEMIGDIRVLARAALNHDIGKLHPEIFDTVMSDEIIPKEDQRKWDLIRLHSDMGEAIFMHAYPHIEELERGRIATAIKYHHERQDGKGYHHRQKWEIPPESQIITIVDAIDVMSGGRPFDPSKTTDEALAELQRCPGQFNQTIVGSEIRIKPQSNSYVERLVA